jgi:hypothetical protein
MKMKRKTTKRAATKKKGRKKALAKRRATARPKRKAARTTPRAKRKPVRRKATTARRRKARSAKPSRSAATRRKPRRAAKRAKPAARKRATAAKPERRPAVAKRPSPRRSPVGAAEATAQPVRRLEPVGTTRELNFAPPPVGSVEALIPHVEDELRRRGDDPPDPEVVNALATAGAGYREGPAVDPPFDIPVDIDARVAEGFVERYWVAEHSPGPDRRDHEMAARETVRSNLDQVGPAGVSTTAIDTLAAVALGTWRPGLDPLPQLNIYANLVAGWYRAGAT